MVLLLEYTRYSTSALVPRLLLRHGGVSHELRELRADDRSVPARLRPAKVSTPPPPPLLLPLLLRC